MTARAAAAVAVAGLVVLGVAQGVFNRHEIEDNLTQASSKALRNAGVTGATVSFSGRDAEIVVAGPPADVARSQVIVADVRGVRVAHARGTGPAAPADASTGKPASSPVETGADGIPPVSLSFVNGVVTMTGTVASDAADAGIKAVLAGSGQWAVIDRVTVDPAVVPADPDWIRALGGLASTVPPDTTLIIARYQDGRVIVRGHPASAALETDILDAASTTVGDERTRLTDGLDVG